MFSVRQAKYKPPSSAWSDHRADTTCFATNIKLAIAEGTFVWRNVKSFEYSPGKSVTRMKRGYIRDSGFLHFLRRVNDHDALLQNPKTGATFEGVVIEEIGQGLQAVETTPWDFSFFRTRNGAEVDLVLTSSNNIHIPVEIKFGRSTKKSQLISLSRFIEQNNSPYRLIINQSDDVKLLKTNILQISAS